MTESDQTRLDRIWDIVEKAGVCMMTTRFYGGMRARPMEARPDREEGVIWFLTDQRGLKDDEIDAIPEVCLIFVYPKEKVYLSITGEAFVAHDPDHARALWNERQKVWWSGPDDPNIRVVRVEPETAEMWDGPANSAVAALEFAKARLTGERPQLGENRKVAVDMG
jgi:general stress protein 26